MAEESLRVSVRINKQLYPELYKEMQKVGKSNIKNRAARLMILAESSLIPHLTGMQSNTAVEAPKITSPTEYKADSTFQVSAEMADDLNVLLSGGGAFSDMEPKTT